jgi:hypothetical protein
MVEDEEVARATLLFRYCSPLRAFVTSWYSLIDDNNEPQKEETQ